MRSLALNLGRVMASLVLSTGALLAQDGGNTSKGFDAQFKIRGGLGLQTDDHLARRVMGFGLDFGWGLDFGRFGLEVGYQYKPGSQYIQPFSSTAAGATDPFPQSNPNLGITSVDSRKNTLEGMTARLSFQRDFNADWGWQGGVQLGGSRFKQEYIGDVTAKDFSYEDTYQGTPVKSTLGVSPYVGVIYHVNNDSHLEFNLIDIGYKSINFVHHPGSAIVAGNPNQPGSHLVYAGDTLEESSRHLLHLEIGYAFHF